ncbi:MAG: GNAT family N-acetyltransferase [Sphingomonadaceae bacterium]
MAGLVAIPAGHVAAIVTYLEMRAAPSAPVPDSDFSLERAEPGPAAYRDLFARVGGPWLWYSRLEMDDEALARALGEVHVVRDPEGALAGFVELDFPGAATARIRFLGLLPEHAGQGRGAWLIAATLALAWREGVERVTVHTCTLDHPAALPAYLEAGFAATGRALETFPDPRARGLLPRDAAPQVPLL